MATGDIAPTNQLGTLTSLLGLIKGSPGQTSTTSSNISSAGINAILQQILGGTQGLAAVSSGQKGAGLYNSTTNQMLVNDLTTRTSGELAKQQAGTTTVTKGNPQVGGADLLTLIAAGLGSKVLGPSISGIGKKIGLDSVGDNLATALGLGGTSVAAGTGIVGDALAGLSSGIAGTGAELGLSSALGTAGGLGLGLDSLGSFLPSLGGIADTTVGLSGAASIGAGVADAAGGAGLLGSLGDIIGSIFSLFSDERLKTDIKKVGETEGGHPIYTYKFKDNPLKTHMGVMAQEVLAKEPDAVHLHPSGALMVDYSKIL